MLRRLLKPDHVHAVTLLLLFAGFAAASIFLHHAVMWTEITGLPSFLISTIPFWVLIAWATADSGETLLHSLVRTGLWGYAFILGLAGVALLIG